VHFQTIFIFRPTHPRYFVSDLDPWAAKVTNERIWDTLGNMTQHYDARVIQFSKEPVVLHRTIFLGNSITEMDRVPTENKGLVRTTRLTLTATYRYFKLKSRVFKLEHSKKLVVIVKVTKILVV